MALSPSQVILYAADSADYDIALGAAAVAQIPVGNVVGDFSAAWNFTASGNHLVIAVGGASLNALFYNPCGWTNPAGVPAGGTPFSISGPPNTSTPLLSLPGINNFENAAGSTAQGSLQLAVTFAYYAVHGALPVGFSSYPIPLSPSQKCGGYANVHCPCGLGSVGGVSGGVGVYAGFGSETDVTTAFHLGWKGVAATGALGTASSPYTQETGAHPDQNISRALNSTSGGVFWLSFWTVSWPVSGDTYYNAGFQAGKYAANTITGYRGKYVPNYMIIDPEGYNAPASTSAEWSDWINGWVEGIASVDTGLKAGFYVNQSQYATYGLQAINAPAFIAVSPIGGNTPSVSGGNVAGYIAYYAFCPAGTYVQNMANWGAKFNTVQFSDSAVDCGP